MAGGGQQSVPEDIKLLGIKPKINKNFFIADDIMKKEGFFKLLNFINNNKVKEISIIGGSHSGLSSAWMLLNGSAMYDYKENDQNKFNLDFFDIEKQENLLTKSELNIPKGNRKYKVIPLQKEKYKNKHIYSELGEEFEYKPWHIGGILNHQSFSHIKIKIIYKNDIKVNYKSREEAMMDGYTGFNKGAINSKGIIYPFTGLRGDAKELWRKIKVLRSEKRIEFVKADNHILQKQAIKNSNVIIWACGYESRPLPILEYNSFTNKLENINFK